MKSKKISRMKAGTQKTSQNRGIRWQRLFLHLTWRSDDRVVSVALSLLVILLAIWVLLTWSLISDLSVPTVNPEGTSPDASPADVTSLVPITPDSTKGSSTAADLTSAQSDAVPYSADRVVLQIPEAPSSFLPGSPCGDHGCSSRYDGDFVTGILVTADGRVALALDEKQSIVVQSSSGSQTVELGCHPGGMTEHPSGLIVVTCPSGSAVLLVSLRSSDHQIQPIQTRKEYYAVAANPADNTLIVGTLTEPSVDVITLRGEFVRTLMDSKLESVTSLTVAHGDLLVTDVISEQVHRIHLSDASLPPVETFAKNLVSSPRDTAVDKAGNVFVAVGNGSVVMRSPEGHCRLLLTERMGGKKYGWRIALRDDRLLLNTVATGRGKNSYVTEYQLVNQ